MLGYWDTYKNYYSNKQEEIGCVITKGHGIIQSVANEAGETYQVITRTEENGAIVWNTSDVLLGSSGGKTILITTNASKKEFLEWFKYNGLNTNEPWNSENWNEPTIYKQLGNTTQWLLTWKATTTEPTITDSEVVTTSTGNTIGITTFELAEIDTMRENILAAPKGAPFMLESSEVKLPYSAAYKNDGERNSCLYTMAGLGIKTYMSAVGRGSSCNPPPRCRPRLS